MIEYYTKEIQSAVQAQDWKQLSTIGDMLISDNTNSRDEFGLGCIAMAQAMRITGNQNLGQAYFELARYISGKATAQSAGLAANDLEIAGAELGSKAASRLRKYTP